MGCFWLFLAVLQPETTHIVVRGIFMVEKSLSELNLLALSNKKFYPSPAAWEDQVLYFMLLDRFSDGKEQGYLDNSGKPGQRGHYSALPTPGCRQRLGH